MKGQTIVRQGSIEVICGSMFAGKTEALIQRIRAIREANEDIQVFKPSIDHRYSQTRVVSHNGDAEDSHVMMSSEALLEAVNEDILWVAVDEVQFFDEAIVDNMLRVADRGHHVIAAGLDLDFKGEPFPHVSRLLSMSDRVTKLQGVCAQCGKKASRTQRLVDGKPARATDPLIVVGGEEAYESRCRVCHIVAT
ncbi:thymidine kinase [Aureibacillus halotolerans]|uniref:Thymidine kinase n=1 Tax=Aureibacillus halotolerans TaxID=1508390 RepID=A0A4R6U232_9BACI|nr:thymidine kinase [Aureibacillus halotolerans]TDQ38753.1 thymidine kinase [Aureibacillus halotolerans]